MWARKNSGLVPVPNPSKRRENNAEKQQPKPGGGEPMAPEAGGDGADRRRIAGVPSPR